MKRLILIFFVGFLAISDCSITEQLNLKVSTTSGILIGTSSLIMNTPVRKFLGVKYGVAPTGDLRFKMPVEYTDPGTIREVTSYGPGCVQPAHILSVISPLLQVNNNFSEDCLNINLFVPSTDNSETPLPVIVFLPGEGYDYGDAQQYDGSYLAAIGQVIVVTVNYRVSIFGFLSTNSEEAPGNVGLYDQRLALHWIKKNILNFGGDPNKVTLTGRFTGAMSAAIHAFSPLSLQDKLFQNVILQSGIPVGDWVFDKNPVKTTNSLAKKLECEISDEQSMLSCIKQKPADLLLNATANLKFRFRPTFDEILIQKNQTIAKMNFSPIKFMLGMNSYEGSLCTIELKAKNHPIFSKLMNNELNAFDFEELLEKYLNDFYKSNSSLSTKITKLKYQSSQDLRESFLEFCGDLFIKSHTYNLASQLVRTNLKTYVYNFAHRPSCSHHPPFIGAAHGDDVLFSLGLMMKLPNVTSEEATLTRRIVEAFSNFAKKGDPNPEEEMSERWSYFNQTTVMNFDVAGSGIYMQSKPVDDHHSVEFFHEIIPEIQVSRCLEQGE